MISPQKTKFRTWEDRWLFKHKRWVALPSIQWKGFWSAWKVRDMVMPAQFHIYIFHSRIVHYNTINTHGTCCCNRCILSHPFQCEKASATPDACDETGADKLLSLWFLNKKDPNHCEVIQMILIWVCRLFPKLGFLLNCKNLGHAWVVYLYISYWGLWSSSGVAGGSGFQLGLRSQ